MRNKGFFWFLTIVIAIVCVYQISYTFVTNNVENQANDFAVEQLDSLVALSKETNGENVILPNGRSVKPGDQEANDIILNYYTNAYLIDKGDKKVAWTGATYNESKNRSINLGLDLKGGMSVTLEVSIPDLVKSEAVNPRGSKFARPYEQAVKEYQTKGGDFIDLFVASYKELNEGRELVRDFYSSSNEILTKESTDDEVVAYLKKKAKGSLSGVENIMNRRINQFGVAQPNIQKDEQTNRIYIELPGVKDKNTVRQKLQSTANLEFFETYDNKSFQGFFDQADKVLFEKYGDKKAVKEDKLLDLNLDDQASLVKETETTKDTTDNTELSLSLNDETDSTGIDTKKDTLASNNTILGKYILLPAQVDPNGHSDLILYAKASDTSKLGSLLREKDVRALYPFVDVRFLWSSNSVSFGENGEIKGYALHAVRVPESGKSPVGGNDIDRANQDYDQFGRIAVSLKMTDKGTSKWAELTSKNLGKNVAIVMDGTVISSPTVQAIMNTGSAQITGNYTVEEAKEFAALLNAGSLPAPCSIIDESIVGPTLGEANINAGMLSFAIALAIVLLYMMFYYGQAGIIANAALLLNILFILGSLASFGAVLTLAGIAGIVLTIGMSVDANVLIFERIREEIAAGKGQKLAIKDGFAKALSSILDANLTTLLTAIILKIFGSGPIESFATTLIIGIFSSVFAAVVISRLIFERFNESKKNISFSTAATKNAFQNLNFSFVAKRKTYYIVSGIIVVIGIGALATKGLKYGVEFTGGRSIEVKFENAANQDAIVQSLKSVMVTDGVAADVIVKTKESKNQVEIQTNYLQGVTNADTIVDSKLKEGLAKVEAEMGTFTIVQSRSVSAVISDELKTSSTIAIVLSLIAIFLYILIRFGKWQYGLGALIAMAHDVIIVLSVFAIFHGLLPFNMDIDQAFIAAILTVVGYSINDTVVVFDRIREVLNLHKRKNREENINDALNSTLSRTINTSLSTFVVLLTIFILGGDAIRGFIFALMIGVIVGTYSSICIATPTIVDLMKNEEEEKR
jgi:SecD/SecF fusion protein